MDYWNGHVKPLWDEIFSIVGSNPTSSTIFFKESAGVGSPHGLENRSNRKVNCSMQSDSAIMQN